MKWPGAVCTDGEERIGRDGCTDRGPFRRGSRDIEHLSSAHHDAELDLLKAAAGQGEFDLGLYASVQGGPLPIALHG